MPTSPEKPPESQNKRLRNLALACGAALLVLLCGWLLSRLPGRVVITLNGAPTKTLRVSATQTASPPSVETLRVLTPTQTSTLASHTTSIPTLKPSTFEPSTRLATQGITPTLPITTLILDPTNPLRLLAGTLGGGVYISPDGGQSWMASNTGLGKATVGSLAIDPHNSKVVYAGLTEQGGVYKSSDGGQTWRAANHGLDLGMNWNWTGVVALAPSAPDVLYFTATNDGVYRSTDGAASWGLRSRDCPQATVLLVDPGDPDHVYAANREHGQPDCPGGIYVSRDGAQSWQRLSSDAMTQASGEWQLAMDGRDPLRLAASNTAATYLSHDGGQTWAQVGEPCAWLAINPHDGTLFCQQNQQLWVSADDGATWAQTGTVAPPHWPGFAPVAFVPASQTVYIGGDGLQKSDDGGQSWQDLGRLGVGRARLTIDPDDPRRLFLTAVDKPGLIVRSPDGGANWQVVLDGIEPGGRLAFAGAGALLYPNQAGGERALLRSTDGGLTWAPFGKEPPLRAPRQLISIASNPDTLWLVGECASPLARSDDGGATFSVPPASPQDTCQALLLADASGARLYAFGWGNAYRSDDGGESWSPLASLPGFFLAAALDPRDPDTVYLGSTHLGVQKSTDGGQTWQAVDGGLSSPAINELAFDPHEPRALYAATDGGLFVSRDAAGSWQELEGVLGPNPVVYSLAFDPSAPGIIFVVTPDGVFKFKVPK